VARLSMTGEGGMSMLWTKMLAYHRTIEKGIRYMFQGNWAGIKVEDKQVFAKPKRSQLA